MADGGGHGQAGLDVEEIHDVEVAVAVHIEELEDELVEEVVRVLRLQDLKLLDEGGEGDLLLVEAARKHQVDELGEVGLAVAEDVLEVGHDVLLCQVAPLLYELGLHELLLVGVVIQESLEEGEVLRIFFWLQGGLERLKLGVFEGPRAKLLLLVGGLVGSLHLAEIIRFFTGEIRLPR